MSRIRISQAQYKGIMGAIGGGMEILDRRPADYRLCYMPCTSHEGMSLAFSPSTLPEDIAPEKPEYRVLVELRRMEGHSPTR